MSEGALGREGRRGGGARAGPSWVGAGGKAAGRTRESGPALLGWIGAGSGLSVGAVLSGKERRWRRVGLRRASGLQARREREGKLGPRGVWVGFPGQFGLSLAGLGLGFSFLYFLFSLFFFFSFLLFKQTQTTLKLFEFKLEFEFNPSTQTSKTMLQHECNNTI